MSTDDGFLCRDPVRLCMTIHIRQRIGRDDRGSWGQLSSQEGVDRERLAPFSNKARSWGGVGRV